MLILIVLAVAIGVTIGLLLPQVSSDAAKITGGYTATGSAADTLNALAVDDNQAPPATTAIPSVSAPPTSTAMAATYATTCSPVISRTSPTNTPVPVWSSPAHWPIRTPPRPSISYVAAPPSAKVQIDHVVALENAWQSGAHDWSTAKRHEFGNDPITCWPSTVRPIRRRFGFRRLLATHQRRLPLRLRGPPDWRQRQVPAHRHLPRKGRHARRPPHLPGPGRARRRIGLPLRIVEHRCLPLVISAQEPSEQKCGEVWCGEHVFATTDIAGG